MFKSPISSSFPPTQHVHQSPTLEDRLTCLGMSWNRVYRCARVSQTSQLVARCFKHKKLETNPWKSLNRSWKPPPTVHASPRDRLTRAVPSFAVMQHPKDSANHPFIQISRFFLLILLPSSPESCTKRFFFRILHTSIERWRRKNQNKKNVIWLF